MLTDPIIHTIETRLRENQLPLAVNFWNEKTVTGTTPVKATLELPSPSALMLLVSPTLSKLAECYVEEKIHLRGKISDTLQMLAPLVTLPNAAKKAALSKWRLFKHSKSSDRKAISSHYDVSNDFFALWLDQRRVYSCAYFKQSDDSLERAQEQKLDHICRKLMLKQGERFLDIGCGWGGLILWAAEHYGVRAMGITISQNQYDYVREYAKEKGISDRVEVRLMDYRDLPEAEPFDKIASVGMFEHVGIANLPIYFRKIFNLLKPGGLVMNHGITSTTFDGEAIDEGSREFIDKYVFPDGELTHISKVMEVMSREGLECRDVENLRVHYAKTLWHWVERLEGQAEKARAMVGEKKFRIWQTYMAGFAMAFERNWDAIYQVLAAKPLADGAVDLPLTREYMYR